MNISTNLNTIAITGANGFIGRYLVKVLSKHNNLSIRVLVRKSLGDKKNLPSNVSEVQGDLSKPESLEGFLVPGCTVINLAYSFSGKSDVNLSLISNLIDECKKQSIKQLIHCSTADVYGRTKQNNVDEITECYPLSNYGKTKLLIEEMLFIGSRNNFQYVNVRPTAIYGPEGQALKKLVDNLLHGNVVLNYLRSCLFNSRELNLVHVSNVVLAIIFLMNIDENIDGETYIVSEDFDSKNKFNYVEKFILQQLMNKYYMIPPIKIPLEILSLILRILGRDSINPRMKYNTDKIKKIGFEYEHSFESGLSGLIEWYKQKYNLKSAGDS